MKRFLRYFFHRDHLIITLSAFLQLWLLGVIAINLDFLNPVADALDNFSITDVFFDIQHAGSEPEMNDLITLVDMTELYDRGDLANLMEDINQCDPLCIGVDLIFEGEKDDHWGNELLKGAVSGFSAPAVFSRKLTEYDGSKGIFNNSVRSFFAEELGVTEAYTNLNDNLAGTCIRDFSIKQESLGGTMLSFPAKIASLFDETVGDVDNEELLINFKNVRFPVVSYRDVIEKGDLIEGHIVLVGTMTEEQDMHNTPLGKMPGLELQAYSLLTLMEHKGIREIPRWMSWLIAFLLCYLLEVSVDVISRFVARKDRSVFMVFLKESNVLSILMLLLWVAFVCWLMFMMFVKHSISLQGGIILALLALVVEGRDIYKSLIKALGVRYGDSKFVRTSLLYEE